MIILLVGRNLRCATEFIKRRPQTNVSDSEEDQALWNRIEEELLGGQKMQVSVDLGRCCWGALEFHNCIFRVC